MKNLKIFLFVPLIFCSCSSGIITGMKSQKENDFIIHELKTELADLKHQVSNYQVEFQILEEKVDKNRTPKVADRFEKRIDDLEKMQEKIKIDLHQLATYASQTSTSLTQFKDKIHSCEKQLSAQNEALHEITKLQKTLTHISHAMQDSTSHKTHRVKQGDSLEKIARQHQIQIEKLKKINGLISDKIVIGQELKISQ